MSTPAGWYPDPSDTTAMRWWDGAVWTVHTQPRKPESVDANLGLPVPGHAEEPVAYLAREADMPPAASKAKRWQGRETPRQQKFKIAFVVVFVLSIGGCAAAVAAGGSSKSAPTHIDAQIMCEQFVKEKLQAPSTAVFSDRKDREGAEPHTWVSVGVVEAKNALGGTVGHQYRCNLTHNSVNDTWSSDTYLEQR